MSDGENQVLFMAFHSLIYKKISTDNEVLDQSLLLIQRIKDILTLYPEIDLHIICSSIQRVPKLLESNGFDSKLIYSMSYNFKESGVSSSDASIDITETGGERIVPLIEDILNYKPTPALAPQPVVG